MRESSLPTGRCPAAVGLGRQPVHDCPGGCGKHVQHQLFACRPCWYRLPTELREPIASNYGRDRTAHAAAMTEARDWYRANTPDAVAVTGAVACPDCGASILWLSTGAGARMPVDAAPDPVRGNVIVDRQHAGVLGRTQAAAARAAGRPLHTHHRLTCPHAARWARPAGRRR